MRQLYANLGSLGTTEGKCFGILVDWEGEGVGALSASIAVIADIARHRRDRKNKNLTTDQPYH
jgi:hypothetical protein